MTLAAAAVSPAGEQCATAAMSRCVRRLRRRRAAKTAALTLAGKRMLVALLPPATPANSVAYVVH